MTSPERPFPVQVVHRHFMAFRHAAIIIVARRLVALRVTASAFRDVAQVWRTACLSEDPLVSETGLLPARFTLVKLRVVR